MDPHGNYELFQHIRIVMGMVVGLAITRLLTGFAGLIQHPGRYPLSAVHLLWVGSILIELVLFWWWEFALSTVDRWSFGLFLFLISYAVTLFLLAALLFPDNISEYGSYESFFLKRRRWFFALFAATLLLDIVDTLIKGTARWSLFSFDYLTQVPLGLAICVLAVLSQDRRVHLAIVLLHIAYQLYWIARVFNAAA